MLKIGNLVRLDNGTVGTIERTSTRSGEKLYRIADRWFPKGALVAV